MTVPLDQNDHTRQYDTPPPPQEEPQRSLPSEIAVSTQDDSPHAQLVASLRSQITDLLNQVNQLNGKLVQSYDRVSDLEDTLHVTSSNLRSTTLQISQLEIERAQHLSALNTGLLVEKSTITAELSRLMERVTEETAQRGQAENAKQEIEKDLDDLSANLFAQANTMVAEARYARAMSERKADEAEQALRGTEEAVSVMQIQMQTLREEKERCEHETAQMRELMNKGKWVPTEKSQGVIDLSPRLTTSIVPYQEFLLFISHLRSLKPTADQMPQLTSLLQLPFLARLQVEDSDPTLRLDLAPSLNWLTRRSVQLAIHAGQLLVEPVASQRLHLEPTLATSILTPSSLRDLTCALCGKHIFSTSDVSHTRRSPPRLAHQTSASWVSTSRFIKSQLSTTTQLSPSPPDPDLSSIPPQTYVFRLSLPPPQKPSTMYPLCHDGFCLSRLRATCELWHFVRKNLIEHVWNAPEPSHHSPLQHPRHSHSSSTGRSSPVHSSGTNSASPPAVPPRRNVAARVGNLWGMGLGALSREKSASRGATPEPESNGPLEKRRMPPPLANDKLINNGTPPPPLPPRRRINGTVNSSPSKDSIHHDEPESPTKAGGVRVDLVNGDRLSLRLDTKDKAPAAQDIVDDTSTVKGVLHKGQRPSGLLTPASEASDGFRTPPEEENEDSSANRGSDLTHELALNTALPESRPTSLLASGEDGKAPEVAEKDHTESMGAVVNIAATSTPPPLPRRAAGRERPRSTIIPSVGSPSISRVGTPVLLSKQPSDVVHDVSTSKPSREEVIRTPPNSSTLEEKQSDGLASPSSNYEISGATSNIPPLSLDLEPPRTAHGDRLIVMSNASTTEGARREAVSAEASQQPQPALPPRPASTMHDFNGNTASFVGDSSWEERTWRELVRLREDMFWAKIGGVRPEEPSTK